MGSILERAKQVVDYVVPIALHPDTERLLSRVSPNLGSLLVMFRSMKDFYENKDLMAVIKMLSAIKDLHESGFVSDAMEKAKEVKAYLIKFGIQC